jgi:hypothetical protein
MEELPPQPLHNDAPVWKRLHLMLLLLLLLLLLPLARSLRAGSAGPPLTQNSDWKGTWDDLL